MKNQGRWPMTCVDGAMSFVLHTYLTILVSEQISKFDLETDEWRLCCVGRQLEERESCGVGMRWNKMSSTFYPGRFLIQTHGGSTLLARLTLLEAPPGGGYPQIPTNTDQYWPILANNRPIPPTNADQYEPIPPTNTDQLWHIHLLENICNGAGKFLLS